jgi:HEAT repeat protein
VLHKLGCPLAGMALLASVLLSGCSGDPVRQKIQALRRSDAATRRAAAEDLGKMGDPRAVEPLIAALHDPDESVGNAAAVALGQSGDLRAVRPLAAALKQAAIRWSAARGLVELGNPALGTLVAALSDEDVEISKALLAHLKQYGIKDPRLVQPLLRQLRSGDWFVRRSAAELLGGTRDPRAVEVLTEALQDENRLVREEVARVLGEIGDARVVEALLRALQDRNTAEVARALGKIGDPRALEPLAAVFHGEDVVMRAAAAEGLGLMKDPRALAVLLAEMLNWELRSAVGDGLAAANWKPATEREQVYFWICRSDAPALAQAREQTCRILLEDVQSKDKPRIDHAVFALVSLGWADTIPELKRILNENGHEEMAETYLNCGHEDLRAAARAWGDRHGYRIKPYGGSNKASWGAWR